MLIKNLFYLLSITLFAIASTILTIFNYNPFKSGVDVFIYFYLALFFAIGGILSLIIFWIKYYITSNQTVYNQFWPSVRQGFLVSLAIIMLLFFKGLKILDWWIGIPIVIVCLLFELFFRTKRRIS